MIGGEPVKQLMHYFLFGDESTRTPNFPFVHEEILGLWCKKLTDIQPPWNGTAMSIDRGRRNTT